MSTTEAIAALTRYPVYDTTWRIVLPLMIGVCIFAALIPAIVEMAFREINRQDTRPLGIVLVAGLAVAILGNVGNFAVVIHLKELHDEAQSIQAAGACDVAVAGIRDGVVRTTTPEQHVALKRLCHYTAKGTNGPSAATDGIRV